jgi:cytochrome c-type biogenesis protein CcmH/NrfF
MRRELRAALQKGDKDDVILHSFVQKYGGGRPRSATGHQ